MARGDITMFEEMSLNTGKALHDFATESFKLGIIDNTTPPVKSDATPAWGDYSANEVSTAGGYTAGGIALGTVTYTEVGGVSTFDAADVVIVQNGSGFTDGYWGIIYNDTNVGKEAVAFVDMGGPVSEQAGQITFGWNVTTGIVQITS